jgi:Ca-activated chloride channel family protein
MHGTSIAQAKRALQRAFSGLRPGDLFNIIAFSSMPQPLFATSQPVDAANLQLANNFVTRLTADGGTEMRSALELALRHPATQTHLRQVIFITDGAVGNEEALFSLIGERLGSGRLFTVGIGSAPNSWFMRKAAEAGRGTFTFISALNEVGEKMDRLFTKIEQPQLTNIDVAWPAGVSVESYPGVVPDLYINEPVSIRAKITGPLLESDVVRVSGDSAGGAWHRELGLHADEIGSPSPGVAALWARARIENLLDEARRGRDDDEVRAAVIGTALRHNLVSKYTSLVAVDKTPARAAGDPLRKDIVPNHMAWGQSGAAIFGFPATATNAGHLRLTGVACLLIALGLLLVGRRREARHVSLS